MTEFHGGCRNVTVRDTGVGTLGDRRHTGHHGMGIADREEPHYPEAEVWRYYIGR